MADNNFQRIVGIETFWKQFKWLWEAVILNVHHNYYADSLLEKSS